MNIEFLGDALDCWKGFLFSNLQEAGILKDFSVDPMLTDPRLWHDNDWILYTDLLRISPNQVIKHKKKLDQNREEYFSEITHEGDLFLDPDTGIAHRKYYHIEKYIKVEEVHRLLNSKSSRLICIYQHAPRGQQFRARIKNLVSALNDFDTIFCLSHETPNAALLFVSKKQKRITQLTSYFKHYLNRQYEKRVQIWDV